MGQFINIGNSVFSESLPKKYVDKTALIADVNSTLRTDRKMSCVTRCRRFGKTMAADMLCAYYDKSCDSRDLFRGLEIEKDPSFETHLNKYAVIYVSMTTFTFLYEHDSQIVEKFQEDLKKDILKAYPDIAAEPSEDLMEILLKIVEKYGEKFFMIIDEWDAILREFDDSEAVMDRYVKLLRRLFKDPVTNRVFVGAYITGIFPIKKYKTQSALNNFKEYSMIRPKQWARHYGFTPDEVKSLCEDSGMDLLEMKKWYDGYSIGKERSMYNPNSVMEAIESGECANYWCATGAYEAVSQYIQMNFEGLKDDIISMLAGGRCKVDYGKFGNDLNVIKSKDDVLTILIHLGYLSYDIVDQKCYIPNQEVRQEMERAIEDSKWIEVTKAIEASDALLQAVLDGDEEAVAKGIEKVHQRGTSILSYHDENSLACVLTLAFYSAQDQYILHREYATGKGFADLVFIPRKHVDKPAIVAELKYNQTDKTALDQIREKDYPDMLKEYAGEIILVAINYDKETKKHDCLIERIKK